MSELLSHTSKKDSIDVEINKHYDLPEEFKDQSMDMEDFKQEPNEIIEEFKKDNQSLSEQFTNSEKFVCTNRNSRPRENGESGGPDSECRVTHYPAKVSSVIDYDYSRS